MESPPKRRSSSCVIEDPDKDRFFRRPLRLDRLFSTYRSFYFVTFNTAARLPMLARTEIHETFRTFALRAHDQYDVAAGRYVLMPDHVHLFVALPREGITLARWLQSLRSVLGKELLRLGFQKPHWQEGFFDHLLRSSASYSEKLELRADDRCARDYAKSRGSGRIRER